MKEQLAETKMHALDYWQVIRNRWGTILLTFLLVCLAALIIVNLLEKQYVGRVKLQVHHDSKDPIFERGYGGGISGTWLETEFKIITSRETLLRVVKSQNLVKKWNLGNDENLAVDRLAKKVEPQEERGTEMISIEVFSSNPQEAADLANAVADAYEERRKEYEKGRSSAAVDVLEMELDAQEKKAEEKRVAMLGIAKKHGIVDFNPVASTWTGVGGGVDTGAQAVFMTTMQDMTRLETETLAFEEQLNAIKNLEGDPLLTVASQLNLEGPNLKIFLPKYHEFKLELESLMLNGLGNKHPKVLTLRKQIEETQKMLASEIEGLKKSLDAKITINRASLNKMKEMSGDKKKDLVQDRAKHSEYLLAKKEYEQQFALANDMREHVLKQKVDLTLPMMPVQRHENAFPSNEVARPNIQLLLGVGMGVGLILGMVLAFFLEYLDTSVKTLDDVERYLGVPVLAVIPKDVGVLHKQSGLSPDAEAYRILRTNIEFNRKSADANAITIVSGGAGEGKSTTLVNLAYICAQGGYNTLMIDGDLRRPKLHTFFDINNSVGLTNYLTTALMLEDVILQTPIDNLYFMPSGILPADAAGILNSRRMSELIQDLKNRFDLVLIDSPPILGVSDASVLASEVDLTIIVIQHRKLPRNMLLRVKQAVENVGGNVLGVVLNNVDVRSDSQYQYYTSYYTYYSPSTPEGKPRSRPSRDKSAGGSPSAPSTPAGRGSADSSGGEEY
ncbi:MAG: polysaccharide biosynthesis tyrosine autokinase [Verrucomicrobiales bacterium]|nr:polysaccharide biosynthesis tyrosine autokinase [Verrucomicrobiales bacterium]